MKLFIYTMLAAIFCANVQAQIIIGKVTSSNGNAIEAATINILNTDRTAIADSRQLHIY